MKTLGAPIDEGFSLEAFGEKIAVWDRHKSSSFSKVRDDVIRASSTLLTLRNRVDLSGARVALLVAPTVDYVVAQRAIWRAGGIVVPLCVTHPLPEQAYILEDCQAETLIFTEEFLARAQELRAQLPFLTIIMFSELTGSADPRMPAPQVALSREAQILYTSGTTGKPKGVVTTHDNLLAQVQILLEAWGWQPEDHTLLVLPLHHTHGIINVLSCALAARASLEVFERFDPQVVWNRFCEGREGKKPSVFMAVPAIYSSLIEFYETSCSEDQRRYSSAASQLRVMVSGSAALPISTLERWKKMTGHTLLERYGMTEIGMALSNPLIGERLAGSVGTPLPRCEVRLNEGEIQVRGPSVFREYFKRPEVTTAAFTDDGWFKTGDSAEILPNGYFKILGRTSVDILKTGGYKISALEVEEELRQHPLVSDVAVVGLPDEKWGDLVGAAVVFKGTLDFKDLEVWLKSRLAHYKAPRRWLKVSQLPRNALGKVLKAAVVKWFEGLTQNPTMNEISQTQKEDADPVEKSKSQLEFVCKKERNKKE